MALGNFTLDIQRFVDKAKGNLDLVVRKVALDLFRRVIMKSPVDTGRFRGNWQVAIGAIPAGTIGLDPHGEHEKHARGSQARGDVVGTATISRVTAATLALKAGEIIYLVNNLAYARALEYGHSKQASAGMVRISVREYGAIVQRAAGEVAR